MLVPLYVPRDGGEVARVVRRAEDAGFRGHRRGARRRPVGTLRHVGYVPNPSGQDPFTHGRSSGSPLNPGVTWDTIAEVAGLTSLPVLVKGILHPEDAP